MNSATLMDPELTLAMVADGYIRTQEHPRLPLRIFNYTEKAVYEAIWNAATRACRGLIVDTRSDEVVARPFRKFFNYGEPAAPELDLHALLEVTDKLDGSLGILYPTLTREFAVATRGSFVSDQALHATALFEERYQDRFAPLAGFTYLFEIVYPANRIVVDYGTTDDLFLLAMLDNATGRPWREVGWPGPRCKTYAYATLADALGAPDRPNCEGLVVYFPKLDERLKLKYTEYVRLHRLLTGLTVRRIWERMGVCDLAGTGMAVKEIGRSLMLDVGTVAGILEDSGPDYDWRRPLLEAVPEEFEAWVEHTSGEIAVSVSAWITDAVERFDSLSLDGAERKDAAARITALPDRLEQAALFALLDAKPIVHFAWRSRRPAHETPFQRVGEDVA